MTIDIEKLAEEHLTPFARTGWTAYGDQLKQFADALLEDKEREITELKDKHIMQLAGISTASIGYFKDGDDIHPDYDTVALRDVTCLYSKYETLFNRDKELQSQINDLREAFRKIRSCYGDGYEVDNIARQALSKTPAQNLQAFENEVIERCAKICDEAGQPNKDEIHTDAQWAAKLLAANIRALKGKV